MQVKRVNTWIELEKPFYSGSISPGYGKKSVSLGYYPVQVQMSRGNRAPGQCGFFRQADRHADLKGFRVNTGIKGYDSLNRGACYTGDAEKRVPRPYSPQQPGRALKLVRWRLRREIAV